MFTVEIRTSFEFGPILALFESYHQMKQEKYEKSRKKEDYYPASKVAFELLDFGQFLAS